MTTPIGQVFEFYEIDALIGSGNIGAVYRAHDVRDDRLVAVKIIDPMFSTRAAFRDHFSLNMPLLIPLDHPNVVDIIMAGTFKDDLYIVTEYITGGNLKDAIAAYQQNGKLFRYDHIAQIGIQAAQGLHFAHDQGMVHLKVKPENFLISGVSDEGAFQVKLADLGLYQLVRSGYNSEVKLARRDLRYIAPEQGMADVLSTEPEVDIYGLGIMLYELVVGVPPFLPDTLGEAVTMHNKSTVVPPMQRRMGTPELLNNIIMACLEKDPQNRYGSANNVALDLKDLLTALRNQQTTREYIAGDDNQSTLLSYDTMSSSGITHTQPPIPLDVELQDRILVIGSQPPTRAVELEPDAYQFIVGRGKSSDIVLDGDHISRYHLRIDRVRGANNRWQYRVTDLGSINGTWLDSIHLESNVRYEWPVGTYLQIEDYRLLVETAQGLAAQIYVPVADAPQADIQAEINTQQLEPLKLAIKLEPPQIAVTPGQAQSAVLHFHNQSGLVDHFTITVRKLNEAWYDLPVSALELNEDQEGSLTINFNPPRTSSSTAGIHLFEIAATSRGQPYSYPAVAYGNLNIAAYYAFSADVHPKRMRRRNSTQITITNNGNTRQPFSVLARDSEEALSFRLMPARFQIDAGESQSLNLRVFPRRRPIFGRRETVPLEVIIQDTQQGTEETISNIEYTVFPLIRGYMIVIALLILFLCALMMLCSLFFISQNQASQRIRQQTQQANLTETFLASDVDGDGLSYQREQSLGTNPNVADTDADGLLDGEEILRYNTNPLNQDSDGDGIIDGSEVNDLNTNPNNRDTDGDGIFDNLDPNPILPPTPEPTPTPFTIPPLPVPNG